MKITERGHLFFLLFCASAVFLLCGFHTFRGEEGLTGANVICEKTPIHPERGGSLWTRCLSDSKNTSYNSDPIVTETNIYVANNNQLFVLDLNGNIQNKIALSGSINTTCHPLLHQSQLFIPLSGGRIQCVDIEAMTSLWVSTSFGGQSMSTLYYKDDLLYAGTVVISGSSSETTGTFYCLNTKDGSVKWRYEDSEHPGGYYWSGAISRGNVLYFSGDNGIIVSHSLTTEEVYDAYTLTDSARVRAGITYDQITDALYTTSTDGILYKIQVTDEGKFQRVDSAAIVPGAGLINCTSTPTIYNNRLYVGCAADQYGCLSVMNAITLENIYTVSGVLGGELKSSPLVCTGYESEENHHEVYVYTTFNCFPGGLYFIRDDEETVENTFQTLYEPALAKQYCMSSVTAGTDGTLYYSNDSGTLFAVSEVDQSSDWQKPSENPLPPAKQPVSNTESQTQTASTNNGNGSQKGEAKAKKTITGPEAPKGIKRKEKKKKVILSWRRKTDKSQTVVYYRYGTGKWKKKIVKTGKRLVLKKGKKPLKIRLRSRIKNKGKWLYSPYTKTMKCV